MSMVETTETDLGQAEGSLEEVTEQSAETSAKYTVKINGVEEEVTLEEALNGYMRQQDFTRKTQTPAQKRAEVEQATNLWSALNADPEATLQVLARQLGVQSLAVDEDEYEDPSAQKLKQLEREIERLNNADASRMIDAEVGVLKSKYKVSDDQLEDIFTHATKHKINLQSAYRDLYFDDAHAALEAVKARRAAESVINEGKSSAGVVHLGTSSAGSSTPMVTQPKTVREAYLLAKQGIRYEGG